MGGKSKKQTIGYRHHLGLHAVFCHGPIDKFTRLSWDGRIAWEGTATGGTIAVDKPELFGGEGREGGVGGAVDVQMGGPTQTKNSYLLSKIGPDIPAYRGVAALVFKGAPPSLFTALTGLYVGGFYWGNNPYLKPVSARATRIHKAQDGATQWNDAKAGISNEGYSISRWRYLVIERTDFVDRSSTSFDDSAWPVGPAPFRGPSSPGTVLPINKAAWFRTNVPAGFKGFNFTVDDTAAVYFNGALVANYGIGSHTVTLPNEGGGLIAVRAVDTLGVQFLFQPELSGDDMNPAHIIRECLTNRDWGMGYDAADVDDASFLAAAETLFDEGLGISILWDKQAQIEDFINDVVRHIDAALFVSRSSGKFVLKLIRDDYDPDTLPLLDESNVERVTEPRRAAAGELVNSVTVNFWNAETGKDDSVTVQDPAGVQMQGTVINSPQEYKGFTNARNASIAAARDHHVLSNPYLSCTVYTGEAGRDFEPGDVFKLTWSKWKIYEMVVRVTGTAIAEGPSDQVRLTVVQDVFASPPTPVVVPDGGGWVDPSQPPEPTDDQFAFETPYYEIAQAQGQTATDSDLAANPDLGYVSAAAARPASAINAGLWTDGGAGFEKVDTFDFCPSGTLVSEIDKTAGTAFLENADDLDQVVAGQHFQIDDELLRLDSVDLDTGEITFGRGVLDTVPAAHAAGARAYFWDAYAGVDPTEYAAGETVDVRITPMSGAGEVPLADAAEESVTLDQRAFRPYPPGNLTVDGDSYVDQLYTGAITVGWAHRDRTQQTSSVLADHFEGDIGPEVGQTYRLRFYADGVLNVETDEIAGTSEVPAITADGRARIELSSKRDGLYSMQAAVHEFDYSLTPGRATEAGPFRMTEGGAYRVTED